MRIVVFAASASLRLRFSNSACVNSFSEQSILVKGFAMPTLRKSGAVRDADARRVGEARVTRDVSIA